MPSLREQVGQLFIVGLSGPSLTALERATLRLLRPGGLILFRRNMETPAQTTALLREATAAASGDGERTPALRALDLEGGPVDRLRDLVGAFPSPSSVAVHGKEHYARRHGELIGRATRLLGFNTPLAPVLDLASPVLGSRSAGDTPEKVLLYARPFAEALRGERVLACGKHFPGLGGGALDSHPAAPKIARSMDRLWAEDLAPFRELAGLLPMIMVAHAVYPKIPEAHSELASTSRFWITDILRRRLEYEGLVVSDDLEMGGLLSRSSIEEAAVGALLAGTDLLEVCREPSLVLRAYEAVLGEAERSPAFRDRVRRTAARVAEHKARLLPALLPRDAAEDQLARLRADLRLFTAELAAAARAAGLPGPETFTTAAANLPGFENAAEGAQAR